MDATFENKTVSNNVAFTFEAFKNVIGFNF